MIIAGTPSRLTLAEAGSILRDALKDKSYRSTPLGLEVARYIRWKRNEWGATVETIRDYEASLARLAVFFPDLTLADFETPMGAERLRECWDYYWGDRAARTRAKILSVWRDFFDWAVREERGIHGNPARMLRAPRKRGVRREPYGQSLVDKAIVLQSYLPDKLGVILILEYGVRRAEIAAVQFRHFDFERRHLVVIGKGTKTRTIPIVGESFWRDLGAVEIELGGRTQAVDKFLVPWRRKIGMQVYYQHNKGYVPRSIHRWWYDRLEEAGITDEDNRRGFGMHRGRHTVASDILRKTGNLVAAQKILGHQQSSTTEEFYAEFNTNDVADVLNSFRIDRD